MHYFDLCTKTMPRQPTAGSVKCDCNESGRSRAPPEIERVSLHPSRVAGQPVVRPLKSIKDFNALDDWRNLPTKPWRSTALTLSATANENVRNKGACS